MNITGLLRKWTVALLFFLFIVPFHTLAAEPEEVLSINININMDWNHKGSGNHRTIGTFKVKVKGKARLTEKKGEFLKYEPDEMRAIGKFKQETIEENEASDCFGQVVMRMEGFDTVPVTAGKFVINGNLGHLGKIAAMQYKGNISPGGIFNQKKDSKSDNYSSVLVAGFKSTQRGGCGNEGYLKEGIIPIGLNIFKELTPKGMRGSYTWKSKDGLPSFMIGIGDFQGDRRFNPINGQGARYLVSWNYGGAPEYNPCEKINKELILEEELLNAFIALDPFQAMEQGWDKDKYYDEVKNRAIEEVKKRAINDLGIKSTKDLDSSMGTDPDTCTIKYNWNGKSISREEALKKYKEKYGPIAGKEIFDAHKAHENEHVRECKTWVSGKFRSSCFDHIICFRKSEIEAYKKGIASKNESLKRLDCNWCLNENPLDGGTSINK